MQRDKIIVQLSLYEMCLHYYAVTCAFEEDRESLVKCSKNLGPVVESIVSLTSSLVVKMLTILVSTISNSQVFLLKKCA